MHVGGGELKAADVSQFRSILLFYVDFCQKQKVQELQVHVKIYINSIIGSPSKASQELIPNAGTVINASQ